jgi:hypothetical protein
MYTEIRDHSYCELHYQKSCIFMYTVKWQAVQMHEPHKCYEIDITSVQHYHTVV